MAAPIAYRACFAIGATLFFASTGSGLAWALLSQHEVPTVEIEDRLPKDLDDYYDFAAIKPRNPIALVFLGEALMREGEPAEATRVFERAVELKSAPVVANQRLVALYLRQGRFEMARRQAKIVYSRGGQLDERMLQRLGLARPER